MRLSFGSDEYAVPKRSALRERRINEVINSVLCNGIVRIELYLVLLVA